jgi:hypothetical protein
VRWPWTREPAAQPAPAPPVAAPAEPPPSPMGWAFLPPIQRTLDTPIAPVTRPSAFPAELPAWRSPAFTSTLSHAVVDTMPGGIVDGDGGGLGAPTHTVGPAPELTLLPPPRPTALQRSAAAGPVPADEPPAPAPADAQRAPGEPDVVRPEPPAAALTRAPPAGMPVVHRSVVAETPPLPSFEQPAAAADAEPAEPSATAGADAHEPPDAGPAADLPGRPPLGSTTPAPATIQRSAAPSEAGRPAVVQRSAAPPLAAPAPAAPRLGLGPPLQKAPDTAMPTPPESYDDGPAPASVGPEPTPPAAPDRPTVPAAAADSGFTEVPIQRAPAPAVSAPPPRRVPAVPAVQPLLQLPAPELTLARSAEPDAAEQPPSTMAGPATAPAAEDRPTGGSPDVPPTRDSVDLSEADHVSEQVAVPDAAAADPPPPALLPSTPLPLASGITTSIQRADLLPGPGSPTPSLVVRPAPLVPQKPARERVVPIQRLAIESAQLTPEMTPTRLKISRADSTSTPQPGPVQRSASPYALSPGAPRPAPALGQTPGPGVTLSDIAGAPSSISPDATPPDIAARPAAVPHPVVSRAVAPQQPVRAAPVLPTTASRSTPPVPAALPLAAAPAETVVVQAAAEAPTPAAETGPATSADGAVPEAGGGAAVGPGTVTVQTATAPPASPGAAAPGAAGGAAGGASATGDVDALAQKLFPAVLRRIKAELLLDRERRGVRTDPW